MTQCYRPGHKLTFGYCYQCEIEALKDIILDQQKQIEELRAEKGKK
jgi:hypothetical protein